MFAADNILETIRMIEEENLDIRTVTMGISLLDCAHPDVEVACENIYQKITTQAKDLVKTVDQVQAELGIPVANRRICVTPISLVASASQSDNYLPFALSLDRAAKAVGVDFIGGFSALIEKGATPADIKLIKSIPQALNETDIVCSSVNIGSSRAGINMSGVSLMGETVLKTAELSADTHGAAAAKLVVFANAVGDNPFMAGAFHGVAETDTVISVGVSGPGVVKRALEKVRGKDFGTCAETIKKAAFQITRMGQLVGTTVAERLGVDFGIVDLSLAPTVESGDSVAEILEELGVSSVGGHGTTAALALLNDAVKKGGLMACGYVGGLSGSFIPVSEDIAMIKAAQEGYITLDKLEAMTAICSVGLDMVAVPGDTPAASLAGMIADEAAIGVMNNKTTAVRVIPAIGKKVGDKINFGGLLGWAPVMAVSPADSSVLAMRGGRIPAPVHAFKN